jgi:hypothetical protein
MDAAADRWIAGRTRRSTVGQLERAIREAQDRVLAEAWARLQQDVDAALAGAAPTGAWVH